MGFSLFEACGPTTTGGPVVFTSCSDTCACNQGLLCLKVDILHISTIMASTAQA
jgi:hypothetical protein